MNKLYLLIALLFVLLTSNASAATTFYGNFNDTTTTCGVNTTSWPTNFVSAGNIVWNSTSQNGKCVGYYQNTNAGSPFSAKLACSPLLNVTPNFVLTYWVYTSSANALDANNPETWLSIWDSNNTVMRNTVDLGNTATTRGNQTMIKAGPAIGSGTAIEHFFNGSQVASTSGDEITYDRWHNVTVHKLSNGTMRMFVDEQLRFATISNSTISNNNTYLCLAAHRGRTVFFDNVTLTDGAGIASTTINATRTEYLEYENAYVTASVVNAPIADNLTFAYTIWYANGTGELMQTYTFVTVATNFSYTNFVNLGNNTNRTETRKISLFVNSTTSQLFNFTYPNVSVTVYKPTLDNCTLTQTRTINASLVDENGFAPILNTTTEFNGNITAVTGQRYSFGLQYNATNTSTAFVCIFPSWATYELQDSFTYYKTGAYSTRNYYLSTTLSNVSIPLTFYLLSITDSSELDLLLKDNIGNVIGDNVISVQRYFVTQNAYITVAQGLTDDSGRTNTWIYQPANTFRFIITTRAGEPVGSFTRVVDSSVQTGTSVSTGNGIYSLTFVVGQGGSSLYNQFGSIYAACTFVNTTGVLGCDVIDSTGASTSSTLFVNNLTMNGWVNICTSSGAGSSMTLTCTIPNWNTSYLNYQLNIYNPDGTYFTAVSGTIQARNFAIDWGDLGFIVTLFIIIFMFGVGAWNPAVALILGGAGLVAAYAIGAFQVGLGSLIGMLLVIAIIIWKGKT